MGKKQHQGDKTYVSANEYAWYYGGKNAEKVNAALNRGGFKRLPFDHCALSMQPFTKPYCTRNGHVFEIACIYPYVQKHSHNPITGEELQVKDLIALNFAKNQKGNYHCPITYKVFNNASHIVAIATSGNVYSMEAVSELNLKQRNMKDLINNAPFQKCDVITIQDPSNVDKFNINNFFHIKHSDEFGFGSGDNTMLKNLNRTAVNSTANQVIDELEKTYAKKREEFAQKVTGVTESDKDVTKNKGVISSVPVDSVNAAHYSKGRVAASLTSTSVDVNTKQEAAVLDELTVKYRYVKKKGYARLVTNYGDLNLELFCQEVPKTCDNFINHLNSGYYRNTIFHRLVKHFVLQGGDPTGTGIGGQSSFPGGEAFEDEFKPNLTHSGRGVLSMANSGPNTNKSQFFITFRSCQTLDGKHTIFGKLVGGMEALSKIEQIKTNDKDRPVEDVRILDTVVFVNPFAEAEKQVEELRKSENDSLEKAQEAQRRRANAELVKYKSSGVGQYMNVSKLKRSLNASGPTEQASVQKLSNFKTEESKVKQTVSATNSSLSFVNDETKQKLLAKKLKLQNKTTPFQQGLPNW